MTRINQTDLGYKLGLVSFSRLTTVLRNARWLHTIDPRAATTVAGVLAGGLVEAPLRAWERLRHGARIDAVEIDEPPVFIVGHWRSGTTHLHNLMSQDPQFGCVRMAQALAPDCAISTRRWLPRVFDRIFPAKRPMDNLTWPMDAPQEEEIPLAKTTPYSWYLQFVFPRQAVEMFRRGVLFEGVADRVRHEVKRKYMRVLKVASVLEPGKRLLLKNPVNTARIPLLLELFPDAKFVAIHRSPYEVFPSAVNLHRKILGLTSFQSWDEALVEQNVLDIYETVMSRWLIDRDLIPAGNLIEIAYADLDVQPGVELKRIYTELGLSGWTRAEPHVEAYIESQRNYRKNGFVIGDRQAGLVEDRWGRFFDLLGYERRTPDAAGPRRPFAGVARLDPPLDVGSEPVARSTRFAAALGELARAATPAT